MCLFLQDFKTGCPERLWILLLWRYWTPAWAGSCAICSRWTCFGLEAWADDLQQCPPTPAALWSIQKSAVKPHLWEQLFLLHNFWLKKQYFVVVVYSHIYWIMFLTEFSQKQICYVKKIIWHLRTENLNAVQLRNSFCFASQLNGCNSAHTVFCGRCLRYCKTKS